MEKITVEQYAKSVATLLKLAFSNGGSATSAAAQVLLSTYNGSNWHVDLTDLCSLDRENYHAALGVIRGRVELNMEPNAVIKDGDKHFQSLWEQWYLLHVANRNLRTCPSCDGSGKKWDSEGEKVIGVCQRCEGAGRIGEQRFEHSRNIGNKFKKQK